VQQRLSRCDLIISRKPFNGTSIKIHTVRVEWPSLTIFGSSVSNHRRWTYVRYCRRSWRWCIMGRAFNR